MLVEDVISHKDFQSNSSKEIGQESTKSNCTFLNILVYVNTPKISVISVHVTICLEKTCHSNKKHCFAVMDKILQGILGVSEGTAEEQPENQEMEH